MDTSELSRMMQLYVYQNMFSSMNSSNSGSSGTNSYSSLFSVLMTQALTEYMQGSDSTSKVTSSTETANILENNTNTSNGISNNNIESTSQNSIEEAIKKASEKFGIDADLIRAVINQESGFNPNAVSGAGAQGLMQLMPSTANSLGVENPFNVLDNIYGGTKYLNNLLKAFDGNTQLALSAYNGGIGRMNRLGVDTTEEISKMPSETRAYVAKVISNYNKYKNI